MTNEYIAPDGQEWLCAACGRHSKYRMRVGDESCYLNAVLVWTDSIVAEPGCLATAAQAVADGPMKPPVTLE